MAVGLGIDIGAHSIKLVQARVDRGRVRVTGALRMEHGLAASAKAGPVDLPPALFNEIQRAKLVRSGVLGISGRDLILRYAVVPPAPPWRMKEIMKFEVEQGQVGEAGELCSDYRILALPGSGLSDQVVTLVALAKTPYVAGQMNQIQAAKLSARHCTPAAIALYQAYRRSHRYDEEETVFLMDVGHDKIEMAISAGGELVFARSMPGGGRKFTEAIDGLFKAGPEKAAEYKHQRAVLSAAPPAAGDKRAAALFNALRAAADQLVSGVNNGVRFCQAQTKIRKLELDRVLLTGGGARLKGLPEYLSKRLGKPVEMLHLAEGIELDARTAQAFGDDGYEMAVALGLAICDADPAVFAMELVPEAVQKRRRFLNKTVYALAAALVMALLAGLMYVNADQAAKETGTVTQALQAEKQQLKDREDKYVAEVEKNESLRKQHEMLRRETRFGLAVLKLLSHLRKVTPQGLHLTGLEPAEKDDDTFQGRFRLRISGQADLKAIPDVFPVLKAYEEALEKHAVILDADVAMDEEKRGTRNRNQASPTRRVFSFIVTLDSGMAARPAADGDVE